MAFDKNAFMAGFFEQAASGIAEKREEARKYKEQEERAYERNIQLIQQRDMRAKQAASLGKQALELLPEGMDSKAMVRNAMASGMTGVADLVDALKQAAQDARLRPGQRLSVFDVEAAISMPRIASIDPSLIDMSLEEFARKTYGAQGTAAPVEDEPSLLGRLFGVGAREQAMRELRDTPGFRGMSIADVNAAARQEEFNQLIPNAVMTITDTDVFRKNDAAKFSLDITAAYQEALDSRAAEDAADEAVVVLMSNLPQGEKAPTSGPGSVVETRKNAKKVYARQVITPIIENTALNYPDEASGFFTNEFAQKTIEDLMGLDYVNRLKSMYDISEDTADEASEAEVTPKPVTADELLEKPIDELLPPETEEEEEVAPQDVPAVDPRPGGRRGFAGEQREWDRKYKGKYDPVTGEAIIVEPRPAEGGPVSGRGKNKKTAAQQWDAKYGNTHNPDGTPKAVEE